VLHLGAFAAYAFWPAAQKPAVNLDDAIVKTRLVKLGKTRDENLLPRLPTAPAPPAADKKAPPTLEPDKTNPQPDSSKKPTAAEILERLKDDQKPSDVRDLIKQRIGEATDEGREDGDEAGDTLDGRIKAEYFDRVKAQVKRNLKISNTLTDEEIIRLIAVLRIDLDAEGNVTDASITKSSGNTRFDNDVLAAGRRASPLPAPPLNLRGLAQDGLLINVYARRE
jgi:periplasmic protein TonB